MGEKSPVYVGIEVIRTSGRLRRIFVYAAVDQDRQLLAIGQGDHQDLIAYLGGQGQAYAAINASRRPNTGAVNQVPILQESLPFAKPDTKTNINTRLCEYLLGQQGLKIEPTPSKASQCSTRAQRGFKLYRDLESFGFRPYPNQEGAHHSLETRAEAIFWRLLRHKHPLPASLEGRIQRQLLLYDAKMPVSDAMDFFMEITRYKLIQGDLPDEDILSFEELNALAAAFIAWQAAHHPEQVELVGDPEEGQIALPVLL